MGYSGTTEGSKAPQIKSYGLTEGIAEPRTPHYAIQNQKIIECLIRYESGGKEDAVGDNGLAYGILQFHRATFEGYSEKYQLDLEYKNAEHQIYLADRIIRDGGIKNWTPWRLCEET